MQLERTHAVAWYNTVVAASLPWVAIHETAWLPAAFLLLLFALREADRSRVGEPWRAAVIVLSVVISLVVAGGWEVAGAWVAFGLIHGATAMLIPAARRAFRPDPLDVGAAAVLTGLFVARPQLLDLTFGGWVAPLVLLYAVRRLAIVSVDRGPVDGGELTPPDREVRGTLSFSGVVADANGLVRTSPLELELRAGSSVAILCDRPTDAADLAWTLCGRRAPASGQLSVDGVPLGSGERLVACVARGEPYVDGDLNANLVTLKGGNLPSGTRAAVVEACSLAEVEEALEGRRIRRDGRPLSGLHRLLVQVARVMVSHYRIVVILDPMPWVNPVRAELWRGAVVRASVGRTAVWLTADRDLAGRADRLFELRHQTLKEA